MTIQAIKRKNKYEDFLEGYDRFHQSGSVAVLCEELGLGKQMSSLISYVSQVPPFKLDENANVCDQTQKELLE